MTNREFWEKYGERFAETDRKLLERIAYHEKKALRNGQPAARQTPPESRLKTVGSRCYRQRPDVAPA